MRKYPIARFDDVVSDLVARRDIMKSLSLAFEGRERLSLVKTLSALENR